MTASGSGLLAGRRRRQRVGHSVLGAALMLTTALTVSSTSATEPAGAADSYRYARWVEEMQASPRGPFSRIRWFCADGEILEPKAYACKDHGGGKQHGQLNKHALELRSHGYYIANLLAAIDPTQLLQDPALESRYGQLLVERFLMAVDDGWIFRRALFYRGAIQEEDERAAGRALLELLVQQPDWIGTRFLALRAGVGLLPHGSDSASVGRARQLSAALSDDDPGFMPLRIKIHGAPDAGDADRVRAYAKQQPQGKHGDRYRALAQSIDAIYQQQPLDDTLKRWSGTSGVPAAFTQLAADIAATWSGSASPAQRFGDSARLLAGIRTALPSVPAAKQRLELLDLSLRLESAHFHAGTQLRQDLEQHTRLELLQLLSAAIDAGFGVGLVNSRLHLAAKRELAKLSGAQLPLAQYRDSLQYLGRAPGWAQQELRRHFNGAANTLAELEPKAGLFIQDQLRGSPLLFYSQLLDILLRDAGQMSGIKHRLFGEEVGVGLGALNPGLARGALHIQPSLDDIAGLSADGIYLLPETVSDLPPVQGIMTAGEGNPLSHIQLLARNLGIPNVTVADSLLEKLLPYDGKQVVLAVSPGGLVQLSLDGPQWDGVFEAEASGGVVIHPDLQKLDLTVQRLLPMEQLSAADSGRTVGPKAAKLAELHRHFPKAVSRGIAIPFGLFKSIALERPHPSGGTVFEWMQRQYRALEQLPAGSDALAAQTEAFRSELYNLVLSTPLPPAFQRSIRDALKATFNSSDVGVFVRSDTNVEDLAGFTGAGLNLTLPNVVGVDALLQAIPQVWASPFTARAFAWRQSHMTRPEHVYTSVLLLESVGSDKSGVMVTADIDTGARDVLSVAVNEGLGGAVDGQAAESLRISLRDESVRVLATATASSRRIPAALGGLDQVPTSGSDRVLTSSDIHKLAQFARELPDKFPPIVDEQGNAAPADVEFGFKNGELRLFQLRPFLDSKRASGSVFLQQMDVAAAVAADAVVNLAVQPGL